MDKIQTLEPVMHLSSTNSWVCGGRKRLVTGKAIYPGSLYFPEKQYSPLVINPKNKFEILCGLLKTVIKMIFIKQKFSLNLITTIHYF
jgi:hypothetical protein